MASQALTGESAAALPGAATAMLASMDKTVATENFIVSFDD